MQKPKNDKETCGICSNEYICVSSRFNGQSTLEPHDWQKVTIKYERSNYSGPLAGFGSYKEYEVCPKCFFEKIKPMLKENNKKSVVWMS